MADILFNERGPIPQLDATAGGQGSFSYADTKVYGNRQFPTGFSYRSWTLVGGVWVPISDGGRTGSGIIPGLVPGTGGGAKLPGKRHYGSRAVGFNPNGAVLIRLFRVT